MSGGWERPGVFLQWKGTDVCLDLHCTCSEDGIGHFDGYFAYFVRCGDCGKVWKLPTEVRLVEPTSDELAAATPVDAQPDEDLS